MHRFFGWKTALIAVNGETVRVVSRRLKAPFRPSCEVWRARKGDGCVSCSRDWGGLSFKMTSLCSQSSLLMPWCIGLQLNVV